MTESQSHGMPGWPHPTLSDTAMAAGANVITPPPLDPAPLRLGATWRERLGIALHAVIPATMLLWTLISAYTLWYDLLGSRLFATLAVLALELAGLVGMGLYVFDLTESRFWRWLRLVLPLVPIPSLCYAIHAQIMHAPIWQNAVGERTLLGLERDGAAWLLTGLLVLVLTMVSWNSWHALEEALIDRDAMRRRALVRQAWREEQRLQTERLRWSLAAILAYQRAQYEQQRLAFALPLKMAEAAQAAREAQAMETRLREVEQAIAATPLTALTSDPPSPAASIALVAEADHEWAQQLQVALLLCADMSLRDIERRTGIPRRRMGRWFARASSAVAWRTAVLAAADPMALRRVWETLSDAQRASAWAQLPEPARQHLSPPASAGDSALQTHASAPAEESTPHARVPAPAVDPARNGQASVASEGGGSRR